MKEQKYQVPILNNEYWVYVYIGKDIKKLRKILVKHFDDKSVDVTDNLRLRGICYKRRCYAPYIWINTKECKTTREIFATLAHEACHAIDEIFSAIGDNNRDEVFAHSVEAIVREIKL